LRANGHRTTRVTSLRKNKYGLLAEEGGKVNATRATTRQRKYNYGFKERRVTQVTTSQTREQQA
jgi:hypothetical protein